MKRRRSLNHTEQVTTIRDFLAQKRWSQVTFRAWLDKNGVTISTQHLSDVLNGRRNPGPVFKDVFKEITGVTLVDGLIEDGKG